jgi:hypothetical protein
VLLVGLWQKIILKQVFFQGPGLHSFETKEESEECDKSVIVETKFVKQVKDF